MSELEVDELTNLILESRPKLCLYGLNKKFTQKEVSLKLRLHDCWESLPTWDTIHQTHQSHMAAIKNGRESELKNIENALEATQETGINFCSKFLGKTLFLHLMVSGRSNGSAIDSRVVCKFGAYKFQPVHVDESCNVFFTSVDISHRLQKNTSVSWSAETMQT